MRTLLLLTAIVPVALGNAELKYCPIPVARADVHEHKCLSVMVYGEARGESIKGMTAVAYTAVNRAVNKRICQVVLAPKQYSIFNNDPSLRAIATSLKVNPAQHNPTDAESWKNATEVARAVLERRVKDPTHGSTYYLAPKVMKDKKYHWPNWARVYTKTAVIDNHHFYRPTAKDQRIHVY